MSTMALDGLMPRARRLDPITSVDAGREAKLHASQSRVLEVTMYAMSHGVTQGELEDHLSGEWSPSRIRSAVSELESAGLLEATGETRRTRYGRQARVYRAVSP